MSNGGLRRAWTSPTLTCMGNAQGWALIGLVGAFATMSMTKVVFSFNSLRSELAARFDAVDSRFDAVDNRFDGVDRRLDNLDRDVQALTNRVFRDRP